MWNPTDLAVHLSRRARGLPFWFSLAVHGTDRYVRAIEQTLATAREVGGGHRSHGRAGAAGRARVVGDHFRAARLDRRGLPAWSNRLAIEGRILCVPTHWQGRTTLRLVFVNPATRAEQVLDILRETTATDHPS